MHKPEPHMKRVIIDKQRILPLALHILLAVLFIFLLKVLFGWFEWSRFENGINTFLFIVWLMLLDVGKVTRFKNNTVKKGLYVSVWGFIKTEQEIEADKIKQIVIQQNPELTFEIKAIANNEEMILKTVANRSEAEKELIQLTKLLLEKGRMA